MIPIFRISLNSHAKIALLSAILHNSYLFAGLIQACLTCLSKAIRFRNLPLFYKSTLYFICMSPLNLIQTKCLNGVGALLGLRG